MNSLTKSVIASLVLIALYFLSLHYFAARWIMFEGRLYKYSITQRENLAALIRPYTPLSDPSPSPTPSLSNIIESQAARFLFPPSLVYALIEIESGGNPNAIRFEPHLLRGFTENDRMLASSHGLLQVLGSNASACGLPSWTSLYDTKNNLACGLSLLFDSYQRTGSIKQALIEYNGGSKCLPDKCPSAEAHANKVLALYAQKMLG